MKRKEKKNKTQSKKEAKEKVKQFLGDRAEEIIEDDPNIGKES